MNRLSTWALLGTLITVGCHSPGGDAAPKLDDYGTVPDFSLTERSGKTVRRADLDGKVWVAAFSFTCCTTHCPQISGTLARLQREWADQKDVVLVTFSVDPEHDTPEVLREYGERYGADAGRWLMLTGEPQQMYDLIRKGFFQSVEKNPENGRGGDKVLHSPRLVLVDRRGHIRGFFDGRQVDNDGNPIEDLPKLRQAVAALLREPS